MDRRHFIRAAAVGAAVISTGQLAGCGGGGDDAAGTGPDLLLTNGDIHTLDDQNSTISSIGIRDGRFVPEGDINRSRALVIDLRGKTVVPGLIESHTHFVSLANRPGYHVAEWELASNIAGVLEKLRVRRQRGVPEGQFITAMGGGTPNMFAERRLPTLAEIDSVVADRPVFCTGRWRTARTNYARQAVLRECDGPAGRAGHRSPMGCCRRQSEHGQPGAVSLRIRQTFDDKKRSALDAMAYSRPSASRPTSTRCFCEGDRYADPASLTPQPTDALFISTFPHVRRHSGPAPRGQGLGSTAE